MPYEICEHGTVIRKCTICDLTQGDAISPALEKSLVDTLVTKCEALQAETKRLEVEALNWRGSFVMLANTINPEEDKPALVAAKDLVAERDRYWEALNRIASHTKSYGADMLQIALDALKG